MGQSIFIENLPELGDELVETRGYGVSDTSPKLAYDQMHEEKKYYGKSGDNPVMHFIVSFDNKVQSAETVCHARS